MSGIQAGTYHVLINAYSAYSGASLIANYTSQQTAVFSNTTDVNIPDNNPAGASSSIAVNRTGTAGNIAVSYNIIHTYRGDLRVQLIAPNGNITTLREPSGGGTNNLSESITTNQGNTSASGTWQLKVVDIYNQDTGYINSWQIEFL